MQEVSSVVSITDSLTQDIFMTEEQVINISNAWCSVFNDESECLTQLNGRDCEANVLWTKFVIPNYITSTTIILSHTILVQNSDSKSNIV